MIKAGFQANIKILNEAAKGHKDHKETQRTPRFDLFVERSTKVKK